MPKKVQLKTGTNLILEEKPFASGGEGDLFRIVSPLSFVDQVVKIYFPEKRTKEREQKIDFLIANPPNLQATNQHQSIIWAKKTVYENGNFLGFMMPIAQGEKLEMLCYHQLPPNFGGEWQKFDLKNPKALEFRLKICFNIAVALYHIHSLGNYVLVDMKPENIIIKANGLISIIDIDSIEVVKNGKILFFASVATPEYTPPEYYKGIKPEKEFVPETWDRFALAVIFYRLLFGIHPFTGSCKSPYEKCGSLAEMIENGLFPLGKNAVFFKVIPPPHLVFNKLDKSKQHFFLRCFDKGHFAPNLRPSAEDWCRILSPNFVQKRNFISFFLNKFSFNLPKIPSFDLKLKDKLAKIKHLIWLKKIAFKLSLNKISNTFKKQKTQFIFRKNKYKIAFGSKKKRFLAVYHYFLAMSKKLRNRM